MMQKHTRHMWGIRPLQQVSFTSRRGLLASCDRRQVFPSVPNDARGDFVQAIRENGGVSQTTGEWIASCHLSGCRNRISCKKLRMASPASQVHRSVGEACRVLTRHQNIKVAFCLDPMYFWKVLGPPKPERVSIQPSSDAYN